MCLADNNWEGVKWYRKAKKLGLEEDLTNILIISQMYCPGMPLEGKYLLAEENGTFTSINPAHLSKITVDHSRNGMVVALEDGVDITTWKCKKPSTPDDPFYFGKLLLKINAKIEQEAE